MRVFRGVEELRGAVGESLGVSDWLTVDQRCIDAFAELTDDRQWIHTDPRRAAAGPFGTTIAHGFLTLSLLPRLVRQVYRVDGAALSVNYGMNKVRFPAPVPVDSQVRAGAELIEAVDVDGGVQLVVRATLQIEGGAKPGCVAEWVTRAYF
jgi:acyl dehydratase